MHIDDRGYLQSDRPMSATEKARCDECRWRTRLGWAVCWVVCAWVIALAWWIGRG